MERNRPNCGCVNLEIEMKLTSQDVLGEDGRIAARLPNYESRPEQLEMANAVERAIADKRHLLVEAGTGVGKSFAYLVPAILSAANRVIDESQQQQVEANPNTGKPKRPRIVVSTNTISLQEQLIFQDIPFLNAVLPVEFSAVLVKGRSNYISLRRMQGAVERAGGMFTEPTDLQQLEQIAKWSGQTNDGSRSDLAFQPNPSVWDEVRSEHGNCLGKKCPTYNDCFYYRARRRVWNADIMVVNHALFFSDLALRRQGASLLPDYTCVILDEAHTVESVAADHMGISVSSGQIEYLFNRLYNDRAQRGLLYVHGLNDCQELVANLRMLSQDFFFDVRAALQRTRGSANGRFFEPSRVKSEFAGQLRELGGRIAVHASKITQEEQQIELASAGERCLGLAGVIDEWIEQSRGESVYWMEQSGRQNSQTKLVCAPIEIGPVLQNELFDQVETVVLTSATLAVGSQSFEFARQRLGLLDCMELKLGSPFDYRKQVRLVLPDKMPDPTQEAVSYETAVCDRIKQHVDETGGRAFVLFTSYRMLQNCASRLQSWFREQQMDLFTQGAGLPRSMMLDRFKQSERGVLFGTDSFWQGVDVPGDALQTVIIAKLPFSVPDHPLLEARLELIRKRGGNPFMDYQVPEAIIKLKQGFGRLIRSKTDKGQVVILDPRVRTKRYGNLFIKSLPECNLVLDQSSSQSQASPEEEAFEWQDEPNF